MVLIAPKSKNRKTHAPVLRSSSPSWAFTLCRTASAQIFAMRARALVGSGNQSSFCCMIAPDPASSDTTWELGQK